MDTLIQDLRYSVRTLVKSPAFAVIATTTLALAIAVNSAVFSLVNVVVFSELPMDDPDQVTIFRALNSRLGEEYGSFTYNDFLEFRDGSQSFSELAAWTGGAWILTGGEEPVRVDGYEVTDNFLRAWGLTTVAGRGFVPSDNQLGAEGVVLLSHGFWMRQFGGRVDVVGSTLEMDGAPHTVIGVLTPKMEFANLAEAEVWLPLRRTRDETALEERDVFLSGRLREGVSVSEAHNEIATIAARLEEEYPTTNRGWESLVLSARDSLLGDDGRRILLLLVIMVAFVLLIACANVANMLLARATARSREIAVRTALGARRGRLVRQLLTENFMIAIAAAGIGLLLSRGLMELLIWITQGQQLFFVLAELDTTVLAFTLLISLIAPLAFGLAPAIRASRADTSGALKEGSARAGSGRESSRLRGALVGAQMSLAVMLMIVAGLIVRSVINEQQRALGFNPANLLTVELTLPDAKYADDQAITTFYRELMEGASGLPDVAGVALVSHLPVIFAGQNQPFEIESQPVVDELERPAAHVNVASADYPALMGIPLVRGRGFTAADAQESVPVALISLEAAERYWPEKDPIGERIRIREDDPWIRIVGIVGNVRPDDTNDERPSPHIYLPFQQNARPDMYVLVRSGGDPLALAGAVRQEVWAVDPNQPIDETRSMQQALFDSDSTTYALITLFIAFALFALCMAAAGIYGVMSYAVSRRAGEFGIRMALGATTSDVRRMVLANGSKLIAVGGVIGLAGAALISRLLSNLVFGISTLDPLTFVGVTILLAVVGLFANYIPARRATRTDPVTALRAE